MTLKDVLPSLKTHLDDDPVFADLDIIISGGADFNRRVEDALRERGLVIVGALVSAASPAPKAPVLRLRGEFMFSVLENPTVNQSGPQALALAEKLLVRLHQYRWPQQRGIMNEVTVESPALEAGPLDGGLVTYFCHLSVLVDYAAG